jgi:hypothetical protein
MAPLAADLLGAVEELIDLESLDEPRERGKQKLPSTEATLSLWTFAKEDSGEN